VNSEPDGDVSVARLTRKYTPSSLVCVTFAYTLHIPCVWLPAQRSSYSPLLQGFTRSSSLWSRWQSPEEGEQHSTRLLSTPSAAQFARTTASNPSNVRSWSATGVTPDAPDSPVNAPHGAPVLVVSVIWQAMEPDVEKQVAKSGNCPPSSHVSRSARHEAVVLLQHGQSIPAWAAGTAAIAASAASRHVIAVAGKGERSRKTNSPHRALPI